MGCWGWAGLSDLGGLFQPSDSVNSGNSVWRATGRTGRDPCGQSTAPTPRDTAGTCGKAGTGWLHPWAQLWPPTRPVWPAKATSCGGGVEKGCGAGLCTAHIPQGILFCMCLGGCSQRKSVTRRGQELLLAPREHLTGSSGTDTRHTDPQPKPGQAIQLFGKRAAESC